MSDDQIVMLNWLLHKIASMESSKPRGYARWDQYLRYEFGDYRAQSLIDFLVSCGIDNPRYP